MDKNGGGDLPCILAFDNEANFVPQHTDGVVSGFRVAVIEQQADLPPQRDQLSREGVSIGFSPFIALMKLSNAVLTISPNFPISVSETKVSENIF